MFSVLLAPAKGFIWTLWTPPQVKLSSTTLTCTPLILLYLVRFTWFSCWSSSTWQDCVALPPSPLVKVFVGLVRKSASIFSPSLYLSMLLYLSVTHREYVSSPPSASPFLSPSRSCRRNHGLVCWWRTACASLKRFFFSRSVSVWKWVMQLTEAHMMEGEHW